MTARTFARAAELVARVPALAAGPREAAWAGADDRAEMLPLARAADRARAEAPFVCHLPAAARRLKCPPFAAFDALELFAFVRPAQFCVPTPRGLAAAAGLAEPRTLAEQALALRESALALLGELARADYPDARAAAETARQMRDGGWMWGPAVEAALGTEAPARGRLDVWRHLPEWSDRAPPAQPGNAPVKPAEARTRLAALLGRGAEPRPQQADYASASALAFAPRPEDAPIVVLAEAGTGVGKTLGYIAPASVWAEKNEGTVWLSTYTRNLQRQIDRELDKLYPRPADKARRAAVRKGRENYLCLLNFEDAAGRAGAGALPGSGGPGAGLGLVARWVAHTRDGDMGGGDFPGWLAALAGPRRTSGLADRRGECVHSACPHWRRCFVERAVRRSREADLVVANHALVLALAAAGDGDAEARRQRFVFDEGHHLFDAADSAFAMRISGLETRDLRLWLRGVEDTGRGRARGLRRRAGDLAEDDKAAAEAMRALLAAARALPGDGWIARLADGAPEGPCEAFLAAARRQTVARARDNGSAFGLETDARPPVDGLLEAAAALDAALAALEAPLKALAAAFADRLDAESEELDTGARIRLDAAARALRRQRDRVRPWRAMLASLASGPDEAFADWLFVARREGRESDAGMARHWIDPTEPFARAVLQPAAGAVVTSATLRDTGGDTEAGWQAAERRTGAVHLPARPTRAAVPSPFDYAAQTRAFVVTDVARDDAAQVAAALRVLFRAAGGGALGLFTAIRRLREAHKRIAGPLDDAGLLLLAQHVDGMDTATLVDIFRAERNACLLGTDALRDGVDVPGDALRLIVFDRVPWPRPSILHKARRNRFGGREWDDAIVRLRLRQAFGRLVRRADDAGVFVMLDAKTPTRLLSAFPEGVAVKRAGLAEAADATRAFLGAHAAASAPLFGAR